MTPASRKPQQDPALIRADDFKSIRIEFDVTNTTTGTAFRKNVQIRLSQLGDKAMVLEVPRKSCAIGHALSIKLRIHDLRPENEVRFDSTAKVENVETFSQGGDSISVALVQYDEKTWERLAGVFASRQKEIEAFFVAARGY